VFVGYHLLRGSEFSCKAINKLGPDEKVGCYALVNGRLRIVEYFELPQDLARATDEAGNLLFGESNPGLFVWSVAFARAQAERSDLPFHHANKKIPHLDEHGQLVQPERPNGWKLESFALDTLPDAQPSLVLWCDRASEFAPVKNATGSDSPASAQELMTRLYAGWLERAGARVVDPGARVEISPLVALDAEELRERLPPKLEVRGDLYLGPEMRGAAGAC
jgi:UDP-N-acetylglucosamine/UDP-N-acetylgalactosamine diphosphorylase